MKLVSMKLDKKREDDDCASPCGEVERPDYPWGTRLNLADEQLAKLGLPAMPAAGAVLDVIRAAEGGPLNVAYVARRWPSAIDSHLYDAIALEIAARACETINGSEERGRTLRGLARDAVLSARGLDGSDGRSDQGPIPDRVAELRGTAL